MGKEKQQPSWDNIPVSKKLLDQVEFGDIAPPPEPIVISPSTFDVKAIKVIESQSRGTYCFSGRLYFRGKRIAEVSNSGNGGADHVMLLDKRMRPQLNDLNKWVDNLPLEHAYSGAWENAYFLEKPSDAHVMNHSKHTVEWLTHRAVHVHLFRRMLLKSRGRDKTNWVSGDGGRLKLYTVDKHVDPKLLISGTGYGEYAKDYLLKGITYFPHYG